MAISESVKTQIDGLKQEAPEKVQIAVDLDAFTAGNVNDFLAANRMADIAKISKALIPFILSCPKEWGEPKDVGTYLNLSYPIWKQLVQHVADVINHMSSKN